MGQREKHPTANRVADSNGDALSTLLETERELAADLERTDEEAETIIEEARTRVRARELAFEASLAAELRNVDAAQETETAAALSRTTDAARARAQRLDAVPEDRVRELAAIVLRDFFGFAPAPGAGA